MNVQTKCKPPSRLGGKLPITFNPAFTMNGGFPGLSRQSVFQTDRNNINAMGGIVSNRFTPNQPALVEERA